MVEAILDNRKSVTRRVVKPKYKDDESGFQVVTKTDGEFVRVEKVDENGSSIFNDLTVRYVNQPYQVGDILYARETWRELTIMGEPYYIFKADDTEHSVKHWKPSRFMPKSAARIFLRVTDVRVEKLQNITAEQVILEGIRLSCRHDNYVCSANPCEFKKTGSCKDRYKETWNSTIKKKDLPLYGWDASPWVWVMSFEVIEK
jgi:ribosomal protein S28E/S33